MLEATADIHSGQCTLKLTGTVTEVVAETLMVNASMYARLEEQHEGLGDVFKSLLVKAIDELLTEDLTTDHIKSSVTIDKNALDILKQLSKDKDEE